MVDLGEAEKLAQTYQLANLRFVDRLSETELQIQIADADLCLGAFGTRPQSVLTVHNKVFECMAMARPVLTGRGPSVQRMMDEGKHIFLCDPGSPESLAESIRTLSHSPEICRRLATEGRSLIEERYTVEAIGLLCIEEMERILEQKTVRGQSARSPHTDSR